jgi:hypothetical protein
MFFKSFMSNTLDIIKSIRQQLEINENNKLELEAKHARELNQMQNQIQNLMKLNKEDDRPEMKKRRSFAAIRSNSITAQHSIAPAPLIRENSKSKTALASEADEFKVIKDAIAIEEDNDTFEATTVKLTAPEKTVGKKETTKKRNSKNV